ncbi:unnamed protein product [Parnassius apollo]|uniref:(apollo) hypothetical protein n=1 Tax=Parnassius apollo TaxID=110799 RepID=A0A8S3WXK8_PARAO|nr:unnamed protein product [Parnassius apollo]
MRRESIEIRRVVCRVERKKIYGHRYYGKYRPEWENMDEFKGWLKSASGDSSKAFCTYCSTEILAKLFDIKKHAETKKHNQKIEFKTGNKEIPFKVVSKDHLFRTCDESEGALILFIAEYCFILSVDHLGELCKMCFKDSKATQELKLHRTKCTEIMKNVLMPHFRKELLVDIGHQKFSVIMESTDRSVLNDVKTAIKSFESENSNPLKLLNTLTILIESVSQRMLMPRPINRNLLDPITDRDINPRPYLSYMFETAQHNLDSEILNTIRQRCSAFLLQLLKELQQRLPDNYKQLESMALLSPEAAIKPIKSNTIIKVAEILGFTPEIIDKIMQQWHILHINKWHSEEIVQFWVEVKKIRNYSGDNIIYQDISTLALTCVSLPHSNPEVERLFSQMNLVKNKQRNRMSWKTLNSILCIRDSLRKSGKCNNCVLPEDVLHKMGAVEKYSKSMKDTELQPSTSSSLID